MIFFLLKCLVFWLLTWKKINKSNERFFTQKKKKKRNVKNENLFRCESLCCVVSFFSVSFFFKRNFLLKFWVSSEIFFQAWNWRNIFQDFFFDLWKIWNINNLCLKKQTKLLKWQTKSNKNRNLREQHSSNLRISSSIFSESLEIILGNFT